MQTITYRMSLPAQTHLRWVIGQYLDELISHGVSDPIKQERALGAVLADLFRIAGDETGLATMCCLEKHG